MRDEALTLDDPEYETLLRAVFPALYRAARRLAGDDVDAAWLAQCAFHEAWAGRSLRRV